MKWVALIALIALMEEASSRDEKRSVWPPKKPVQKPPKLPRKGFNFFFLILYINALFLLIWASVDFLGFFLKIIIYIFSNRNPCWVRIKKDGNFCRS